MSNNETTGNAWEQVESLLGKLAEKLMDFSTVEVRTLVTDLEFITEKDDQGNDIISGVQPKHDVNAKPEGFVTAINMVGSDISFDRSPNLPDGVDVDKLEALHEKHVAMARQIFQDNIEFVVKTVKEFIPGKPEE
ncbi:MAG: hypothetical protein GY850_04190 [bacterium]|nr:hypothetical protein [bacterium]